MNRPIVTPSERIEGGIVGALVGDAIGVPVEFEHRSIRARSPVTGLRSGGRWGQPAGTWSDDGSLLLASTQALIEGFNLHRMGREFEAWLLEAKWSARHEVFDVGNTTRAAIYELARGVPPTESGQSDERSNGNGSLMRILPVALRFWSCASRVRASYAVAASAITHAHRRSGVACAIYCEIAAKLCSGLQVSEAIRASREALLASEFVSPADISVFARIFSPDFTTHPCEQIRSGGYVVETLEAALWCVLQTSSYSDCVLSAVNLGGDTDTTACVAGGLAGTLYGVRAIPAEWLSALPINLSVRTAIERFTASAATP